MIRFLVWTVLCVGFGIFLATFELGSTTPWKMMQSLWKEQSPALIEGAKKKAAAAQTPAASPKETHTAEDKQAIDQLISKRKG